MRTELQQGAGLLVRFEDLHDNAHVMPNVRRLQGAVDSVFGTESTVHLYHATENASRALMPHTDPYDVIVMQLQGSKQWTTCVPGAQTVAPTSDSADPADDGDMASFTDAQLGQLQEIRRQRQQGCTSYTDENLRGMKCSTFTLNEGDTLYLPKGIIHYAIAQEGGSSHITISLERKGLAWADALLYGASEASAVIKGHPFHRRWAAAVKQMVSTFEGVPYLEAIPSWLFTPSNDEGDGTGGMCAAADGELSPEAESFINTYQELCNNMAPFLQRAYADDEDMEAFFFEDFLSARLKRVCSADVAERVLEYVCSKKTFPVDVTTDDMDTLFDNTAAEVCVLECVPFTFEPPAFAAFLVPTLLSPFPCCSPFSSLVLAA